MNTVHQRGEGIVQHPRQNGVACSLASNGFVSNYLVFNAHTLAKVNYVIRNNVTNAIHTYFYAEMRIQFHNRAVKIAPMARVFLFRGEGISNTE